MNIRKSTVRDSDKIEEINKKFDFEEGRNIRNIISSEGKGFYICEENKQIIGFLGYEFAQWNKTIKIINIFIIPDFRKKGYASQLLKYLINQDIKSEYRGILAEAPSKSFAPLLYRKNGFQKCGYNDRYYDNKGTEIAEFYFYNLMK